MRHYQADVCWIRVEEEDDDEEEEEEVEEHRVSFTDKKILT